MEGRLRLLRPPGRDRALLPNLRSAVFQSPIRAIQRVYFGMACSGYTLQMSVDARLGEVRADERKIRQVVLNLLSNAIKFTPEGGRIEVTTVPRTGP
jgi:signal transduction histidine kinase